LERIGAEAWKIKTMKDKSFLLDYRSSTSGSIW